MECIKQPMLGPIRSEAFKASFKLGRDGDLINKMHLQIKLPEKENKLCKPWQLWQAVELICVFTS